MFYVQEREKKKKERKKKAFPLPSSFQKNKNKIVAKLRRILTRVGVVCKEQKKKNTHKIMQYLSLVIVKDVKGTYL